MTQPVPVSKAVPVPEAVHVSKETARRFALGRQGLWPGRRWRAKAGAEAAMTECENVQLDPLVIVAAQSRPDAAREGRRVPPGVLPRLAYAERRFFDWGGWLAVRPMDELPYWRVLMRRSREHRPRIKRDRHAQLRPDPAARCARSLRDRGTVWRTATSRRGDRRAVDTYRGTEGLVARACTTSGWSARR